MRSFNFFWRVFAYAKLIRSLYKDPRTPKSFKIGLWLLLIYFLIPTDIISDFIPVLGQIDDAVILMMGLRWLIKLCPPDLILEHRRQ